MLQAIFFFIDWQNELNSHCWRWLRILRKSRSEFSQVILIMILKIYNAHILNYRLNFKETRTGFICKKRLRDNGASVLAETMWNASYRSTFPITRDRVWQKSYKKKRAFVQQSTLTRQDNAIKNGRFIREGKRKRGTARS